ncbi:hypothetical protein ABPG72_012599 [Tetrahymena utriculariae]
MRIQKAQEDQTKQTTGKQIENNFKTENDQNSKIKSYQGQEYLKSKNIYADINTCIQSPLNTDKEKFGLDSLKSPWSILKLENTGSNFNNTSQINTLSLIGENRMTPKDFDELLYIKKVNHYNQLSNVNAEQMLKKMLSNTDSSHLMIKSSSQKEFLPVELDQDLQNKSQQQLILQQDQDKSQLNNQFINGQSNPNHPNSQIKSRLQVKSIKMYETENSFVQPKRLNLDSSFQRKSNISFDKENQHTNQKDQASEKLIENSNARQDVANQQYLKNLLAGDEIEFKQQNKSQKNIELISAEIAYKKENPFRNQNQSKDQQTKINTLSNKPLGIESQNKLIGEHKRLEDDQMITSTSSSGVKRVQFSMDATTAQNQNMKEKQQFSSQLKNIFFQNQKIQCDNQIQIQQQYKNNTTNNNYLINQKKHSQLDFPSSNSNALLNNNHNTSLNQSNHNAKSNSSHLNASNNINSNTALVAAINMDKRHSSSFNNFLLSNTNESNKQLIQALSNLKNEYRRSFYSRQIDSILEEKVRQHHSRENSRDKLQLEGLNSSKSELQKRPLTAKLIQSTLHRKNSSKDKSQIDIFQNIDSNQDSKLNHAGDSFGHQSTISVMQNKNNNNTSNQYRENTSKLLNNPLLNSSKQIELNEKTLNNNENLLKVNALNNITFSKIQTSKSNIDISSPKEIDSALNKKINLENVKDVQFLFNLIKEHVQKCPNFCNEISKFLD